MNIEKMLQVINKGNVEKRWGLKMVDGEHYYRMLFKFEKLNVITLQDVQKMFASFVNWRTQIDNMIADCQQDSTDEDQKAIRYAEVLVDDILGHMHKIITDAEKTEPANQLEELLKYIEEPNPNNQ